MELGSAADVADVCAPVFGVFPLYLSVLVPVTKSVVETVRVRPRRQGVVDRRLRVTQMAQAAGWGIVPAGIRVCWYRISPPAVS